MSMSTRRGLLFVARGRSMSVKAPNLVCPHCSAENSATRDICFKCRESLEVIDGSGPPLPSVFNLTSNIPTWNNKVWHEVSAPGTAIGPSGPPAHEIMVREVGTESLIFDSDFNYQPSEGVALVFTLNGKRLLLVGMVKRSARTLGTELGFATTIDLIEPDPEYLDVINGMNPVDDKEWWD